MIPFHPRRPVRSHKLSCTVYGLSFFRKCANNQKRGQPFLKIKTPKKGGMGLNDSLKHICQVAKALADEDPGLETLKQKVCF